MKLISFLISEKYPKFTVLFSINTLIVVNLRENSKIKLLLTF